MRIKFVLLLAIACGISACSFSFNGGGNNAAANANTASPKPTITPSASTPTPQVKAPPVVIAPKTETTGDGDDKRISFKAGSSSATVSDAVIRGERSTYLIGAKNGQTMTVKISSLEDNAVFQIESPSGSYLPDAGEEDDATTWSGPLPTSGDYRIIVGGTRGNATYKLTVSIK